MNFDTVAEGDSRAHLVCRSGSLRSYLVDCQPLLREHELLVRVTQTTPAVGPESSGPGFCLARAVVWGTGQALLVDIGRNDGNGANEKMEIDVMAKTTQGHAVIKLSVLNQQPGLTHGPIKMYPLGD